MTDVLMDRRTMPLIELHVFATKQGRIHGSISRGRVGRSGKPLKATFSRTDGHTDLERLIESRVRD